MNLNVLAAKTLRIHTMKNWGKRLFSILLASTWWSFPIKWQSSLYGTACWATTLKPIQGITRYQHFTFSNSMKGKVSAKSLCDGEEKTVNILKRGTTLQQVWHAQLPNILQPDGMTTERKQYLYKIRQHVWPDYRDTLQNLKLNFLSYNVV